MPQLMPMSWNVSFLLVVLLFVMMMELYFMKFTNYNFCYNKSNNNNDTILNWKW